MRFVFEKIDSITFEGIKETCDATMVDQDHPSYVANNFVVHNSINSGAMSDYVSRKLGKTPVRYAHPIMEKLTKDTMGVIVYQEQIMSIMHDIGGASWSTSEMIRKAISKSQGKAVFDEIRNDFVKHAIEKLHMPECEAVVIFDNTCTFGAYGFNKSHSTCYSILSYYCAWLKTYFSALFFAALLNRENDPESSKNYIQSAKRIGITTTAPHINKSEAGWTKISDTEIACGLLAIKGVGESAVKKLISGQPYADVFKLREFANKGVFKALVASGACDCLIPSRRWAIENLENLYSTSSGISHAPEKHEEYDSKTKAVLQNEYLDFFSDIHLITFFEDPFKGCKNKVRYEPIASMKFDGYYTERWIKGIVNYINFKQEGLEGGSKMFETGFLERKYAHLNVNDESGGNIHVHLSPEQYTFYKRYLERSKFPVVIKGHSIPGHNKIYCDAMIVLDDIDKSNPVFDYISGRSFRYLKLLREEYPVYENYYLYIGVLVSATYKVQEKQVYVRFVFTDNSRFTVYELIPNRIYAAGQIIMARIREKTLYDVKIIDIPV